MFQQAEIKAEGLIAWMRLGITSTLVLAFALALGTADVSVSQALAESDVRRWQVFYALGTMSAYFVLGTLCLLIIKAGRFRAWMVWPSAAGDCLFILSGAWLGLQNTGLTGDYIVVLPTLWLIPVVLASGVLRFNPHVQLFIIVFLVAGLIVVTLRFPTLENGPVNDAVAVFFAQPPNIMRLVMIALAGVVLVIATWRTRNVFLRALSETERRENLTRYVPSEIAPELAQAGLEALQGGTRQNVAILFVDIRGFTARSETMSPEALTRFVTEYRAHITQAARDHNGIVDKFMGDAVMLIFDPRADVPPPAARAVACGQEVLKRIKDWPEQSRDPVTVGIGIHYGEVFVGVIGDDDRLEFSVFGDAVNIAARLEEMTKSTGMTMVVSQAVLENAGLDATDWHAVPEATLRGRSGALAVYGRRQT